MDAPDVEYSDLKRLVTEQGLLDKQPGYYALKIVVALGLLALSLSFVVIIDNPLLQMLGAVFLAFTLVQIGFLGHDAGHRQIANLPKRNDIVALFCGFFMGSSRSWWISVHNQHHANPNDPDLDPHISIPGIAFSQKEANAKKGLSRFLVKYQAYYFIPLMLLEGLAMRLASIQFMFGGGKVKYPVLEPMLVALHFLLYFSFLFYVIGGLYAVAFIVVHQMLFGLYMSSVFAPNHKGMPMLDKSNPLGFLRQQVLTSRNVVSHPLTDFFSGGLNYQIEHHLFPNMPRNKLREAQKIVRQFCLKHNISYYETSVLRSWKEILESLHEASAPLRASQYPI